MRKRERVEVEAVADESGTRNKGENQIRRNNTHAWKGWDKLLFKGRGTSYMKVGPSSRSQQPLLCSRACWGVCCPKGGGSFCGVTEDTFEEYLATSRVSLLLGKWKFHCMIDLYSSHWNIS